jgi:excinuclease ABC subunit B
LERVTIYPASHYVTPKEQMERAMRDIEVELQQTLATMNQEGRLLEAQRLEERTAFDLEFMRETGRCKGIENYSRHLSGRNPGEPPPTLLEFFPADWLLLVDESHVTLPQVMGMYKGDRSRKQTLVRHGFRLPSAMDNRPLQFTEFERHISRAVFVSATPRPFELERVQGVVVEQIIRPTGLLDPPVEVRGAEGQVDDLLAQLRQVVAEGDRALVTVLTKRFAQELTDHYHGVGLRVRYLHADVDTLERMEILRDLRKGVFDVLVGINLLREGLDIPEVSLVAIMDADKEGFLRNRISLIQTMGRASRNVRGRVILYADKITKSIRAAMDETERRRQVQAAFNAEHGITPAGIQKAINSPLAALLDAGTIRVPKTEPAMAAMADITQRALPGHITKLRKQMGIAAGRLEFERAAALRDRIRELETWAVESLGEAP